MIMSMYHLIDWWKGETMRMFFSLVRLLFSALLPSFILRHCSAVFIEKTFTHLWASLFSLKMKSEGIRMHIYSSFCLLCWASANDRCWTMAEQTWPRFFSPLPTINLLMITAKRIPHRYDNFFVLSFVFISTSEFSSQMKNETNEYENIDQANDSVVAVRFGR